MAGINRKIDAMHSLFGVLPGKRCEDCEHLIQGDYHGVHLRKCADVNEWFDTHGFDAYELRDGGGNSLEEIEYGTDNAVDNFLKMLETMDGGEVK